MFGNRQSIVPSTLNSAKYVKGKSQANDFALMLPSGCSSVVAVSELTREVDENRKDATVINIIISKFRWNYNGLVEL
ncbi:hypothetical protein SORBI_3004G144300 [Sorghum bicolor]|jgi:hypothetical protein|uniref:Uncharacterized protein n=1 Tax=Sorghum bicolor TaxID=4558 RepID=A0A194YPN8_SORBI|nr:hypothetical protein SORBI_3004G144300 [Sorghum bicolor]